MARAAHQSLQRYPLSMILGTDAGVRLSRELSLHGGQLAAPDLARRTGLSKASVARGLSALVGSGAFDAVGSGRGLLYRLRADHPLAPAIQVVFEAEAARFRNLLASAGDVAHTVAPDHVALWLYGSVARGEDHARSDVDLALIIKTGHAAGEPPNRRRLIADAFRDGLEVSARTGAFRPSVVVLDTDDVARLSSEHDPWWQGVLTGAQAITGEPPEQLAERHTRRARSLPKGLDARQAAR